jgi:hypothetical protein
MNAGHLTPPPMPGPDYGAELRGRDAMPHVATADELLAAALEILRGGGFPLPCRAGGKQPVTLHSFNDAPNTERGVREWFTGKGYNLAEPTGKPGRFDVLDVDVRADGNGWEALNRLKEAGLLAGAQRLVRTPSGGLHLKFAATDQRCGSLKAEHLDFKSTGGYVLVPPSQVGGRRYQVLDERPPTGIVFDWTAARRLLSPPRPFREARTYRSGPSSARHLVRWLDGEFEGNRNNGLYWACCRALEAGDEDVVGDLADVAFSVGLGEDEVRKTIGSAYRKAAEDGW